MGTTLVDPDGRLLSANQALCDMLGYTEREIQALTFQQITHPDDLAQDLAMVEETLAGRRSSYRLRKRYLHADGHVVHGDLSVALLRAPDGTPIHFISQILDVTEAHEAAERLAETSRALDRQRRHLEAILDSVDVGVAVIDPDSGYLVVNRRHQQYIELAHPDDAEDMAGEPGDIFTEDGRRLEAPELPSNRAAAGEEFDDLILRVGTDPVTQRALSVSARSVRGDGGEFSGAVLAYTDVTELVRALTAKDHFVAAVSHELRTPLTSVLGNLELIADSPELTDEVSERVRVVQRNAERLRELVADLLLVAQMTDGRLALTRQPVDLADLVATAAARRRARGGGCRGHARRRPARRHGGRHGRRTAPAAGGRQPAGQRREVHRARPDPSPSCCAGAARSSSSRSRTPASASPPMRSAGCSGGSSGAGRPPSGTSPASVSA